MSNPYLNLPLWIPRWLRNIIVRFEYVDCRAYLDNRIAVACKRLGKRRDELTSMEMHIISVQVEMSALLMGHSPQWLAWQWAHEDVFVHAQKFDVVRYATAAPGVQLQTDRGCVDVWLKEDGELVVEVSAWVHNTVRVMDNSANLKAAICVQNSSGDASDDKP